MREKVEITLERIKLKGEDFYLLMMTIFIVAILLAYDVYTSNLNDIIADMLLISFLLIIVFVKNIYITYTAEYVITFVWIFLQLKVITWWRF